MKIKTFNHSRRSGWLAWPLGLSTSLGLALAAMVWTISQSVQGQQATDPGYVFASFDPPGSVATFPVGINNNGLITLQYNDAAGIPHSSLLKDGRYTLIDPPGTTGSLVSSPNMEGQVALSYFIGASWPAPGHVAVYTRGLYTYLPDAPGYLNTSPSAINA
jgi:hypothetical protein